ncbi:NFACT RNA binding domain-containing protein [Campylobacter sp. TTU_617]|uniref:NFACT RNA binding domain-containing protein n=1 Tax=Campylobacter sp. TTU_617 TaxID=2768148 RepID=UPI00190675FD|nr:NFACT RNA binding domain-containing protein [Campylobacter sp. TTU_617]MBK1972295.1 DUF814 domain-containing protein [Campylobacter sp. TTU_617]
MKYNELLQIKNFFINFKKIDFIKRIDDNILELSLDRQKFIIDLNRSLSAIYQAKITIKNYNAPFDFMLKKYFNNAYIKNIEVLNNNRVLCFYTENQKAYKNYKNKIYFEFTGRNTNAIITDYDNVIIEALRHIDKSFRPIKPSLKLEILKPYEIKEEYKEIKDFQKYFKEQFQNLYQKRLEESKSIKLNTLNKKIQKIKEYIFSLEKEDDLLKEAKNLSFKADVLFANLNKLKEYERKFELKDFYGQTILFNLEYNPKQSANIFYKKSKKLKQRAKNISIERNNLLEKMDFYEKLYRLLCNAKDLFELELLFPRKKLNENKKIQKDSNIVDFYFNEFKISVGKNEKGNEFLLKNSKKEDLWFHIKDFSSAHVFITSNKQKINEEVIEFAAKLCINFSNLKPGSYLVDYTKRNFVKIKEKALVNYTNFKSMKLIKE